MLIEPSWLLKGSCSSQIAIQLASVVLADLKSNGHLTQPFLTSVLNAVKLSPTPTSSHLPIFLRHVITTIFAFLIQCPTAIPRDLWPCLNIITDIIVQPGYKDEVRFIIQPLLRLSRYNSAAFDCEDCQKICGKVMSSCTDHELSQEFSGISNIKMALSAWKLLETANGTSPKWETAHNLLQIDYGSIDQTISRISRIFAKWPITDRLAVSIIVSIWQRIHTPFESTIQPHSNPSFPICLQQHVDGLPFRQSTSGSNTSFDAFLHLLYISITALSPALLNRLYSRLAECVSPSAALTKTAIPTVFIEAASILSIFTLVVPDQQFASILYVVSRWLESDLSDSHLRQLLIKGVFFITAFAQVANRSASNFDMLQGVFSKLHSVVQRYAMESDSFRSAIRELLSRSPKFVTHRILRGWFQELFSVGTLSASNTTLVSNISVIDEISGLVAIEFEDICLQPDLSETLYPIFVELFRWITIDLISKFDEASMMTIMRTCQRMTSLFIRSQHLIGMQLVCTMITAQQQFQYFNNAQGWVRKLPGMFISGVAQFERLARACKVSELDLVQLWLNGVFVSQTPTFMPAISATLFKVAQIDPRNTQYFLSFSSFIGDDTSWFKNRLDILSNLLQRMRECFAVESATYMQKISFATPFMNLLVIWEHEKRESASRDQISFFQASLDIFCRILESCCGFLHLNNGVSLFVRLFNAALESAEHVSDVSSSLPLLLRSLSRLDSNNDNAIFRLLTLCIDRYLLLASTTVWVSILRSSPPAFVSVIMARFFLPIIASGQEFASNSMANHFCRRCLDICIQLEISDVFAHGIVKCICRSLSSASISEFETPSLIAYYALAFEFLSRYISSCNSSLSTVIAQWIGCQTVQALGSVAIKLARGLGVNDRQGLPLESLIEAIRQAMPDSAQTIMLNASIHSGLETPATLRNPLSRLTLISLQSHSSSIWDLLKALISAVFRALHRAYLIDESVASFFDNLFNMIRVLANNLNMSMQDSPPMVTYCAVIEEYVSFLGSIPHWYRHEQVRFLFVDANSRSILPIHDFII